MSFLKLTLTVIALVLSASSNAGTVGMSGVWDFNGQMTTTDYNGLVVSNEPVIGEFDFNSGLINLALDSPFFGPETWYSTGTIEERLDGTYWGSLEIFRNSTSYNWSILWDITQQGNSANITTLDGDGDGIPGISLIDGPFVGFSHAVNGALTSVPVPAAVWLFGSGLIGLIGMARRKKV